MNTTTANIINNNERKKLVIVEGNISAGKSTLSSELAQLLNYALMPEPALDNPYLKKFYKQPTKYALTMQLYLLRLRYSHYIRSLRLLYSPTEQPIEGVILDRSIFSDAVFAEQNFEDGHISQRGMAYYRRMRGQMMRGLPLPDLCLYLDVTPEECLRRINEVRMRECESGIPLRYLQGLERLYNRLLRHLQLGESAHGENTYDADDDNKNDQMGVKACKTIVRRINWNQFGDTRDTLKLILKDFGQEQVVDNAGGGVSQNFLDFLFDDEQVNRRLELPSNPPEELYFDEDEKKDEEMKRKILLTIITVIIIVIIDFFIHNNSLASIVKGKVDKVFVGGGQ